MGGASAKAVRPAPPDFGSFSLRFHEKQGAFSVLHANKEALTALATAINQSWAPGYTPGKKPHECVHTLKLQKYDAAGFWQDARAYVLMCRMLDELSAIGWQLTSAPDLFLTLDDAELIFQKTQPRAAGAGKFVFAVRIVGDEGIQLQGVTDGRITAQLRQVLSQITQLTGEKMLGTEGVEYMLAGKPWRPDTVAQRLGGARVLMTVVKTLNAAGYNLVTTACLDGEQDAIFFNKHQGDISPVINDKTHYGCIALTDTGSLVAMGFSSSTFEFLTKFAKDNWLQAVDVYDGTKGAITIKLTGEPWLAQSVKGQANEGRLFFLGLLEQMALQGWHCLTAADVSQELEDKSMFIFYSGPRMNKKFIGLQPVGQDKLWCLKLDERTRGSLSKILDFTLGADAISFTETLEAKTDEFEIRGKPWCPEGDADALLARHVLNITMMALTTRGWRVLCSADLQGDVSVVKQESKVVEETTEKTNGVRGAMMPAGNKKKVKKITRTSVQSFDSHMIVLVK